MCNPKISLTIKVFLRCCILILDQAVNQRFSAQDAPAKISGNSLVVKWKCVGVMKWYMQMPTSDTDSLSLSFESAEGAPTSGWAPRWDKQPTAGLLLSTRRPRSRSTKWSLEDNAAWYGQEKMKSWVNVAVSIHLPPSVLSLWLQKLWLQEE